MKKAQLLFIIAALYSSLTATTTDIKQSIATHNNELKMLFVTAYGKENPFLDISGSIDLLLDAAERPIGNNAINTNQSILRTIDSQLQACITSFIEQKDRHATIFPLHQTCSAITQFFYAEYPEYTHAFITTHHKSRFAPEALLGISALSGTFKGIMVAVLGASALLTAWKIYRTITKGTRNTSERITREQKKLHDSLITSTKEFDLITKGLKTKISKENIRATTIIPIKIEKPTVSVWSKFKNLLSLRKNGARLLSPKEQQKLFDSITNYINLLTQYPDYFKLQEDDLSECKRLINKLHTYQKKHLANS